MKNTKIYGWVLIFLLLVSGLVVPLSLVSTYIGIDDTIRSIQFPASFIEKSFNSSHPWLKLSFFIKNLNQYDLKLHTEFGVDVVYLNDTVLQDENVMRFSSSFPLLLYDEYIFPEINITSYSFDTIKLNGLLSRSINLTFQLSASFVGSYLNNLMGFQVSFSSYNISDFEF